MTLYASAVEIMGKVKEETAGMQKGQMPSIYVLLDLQRQLTSLYHELGEEQSAKFSSKEASYLKRKIAQAKMHQHGRHDLKLTSKDAEVSAQLGVGEEIQAELDSMSEFEHLRILRDSVDRAYMFVQQVISSVKWMEQKPSQHVLA